MAWTMSTEQKAKLSESMKKSWQKRYAEGRATRPIKKRTKRGHWTRTPKGRKHMAELARLKVRQVKQRMHTVTNVYHPSNGHVSVVIQGPDALKALNELVSNAEYERLDVHISIEKK